MAEFSDSKVDLSDDSSVKALALKMKNSDSGIEIRDRSYRFKVYRRSFISSEAVEWMIRGGFVPDFQQAELVGRRMQDMNLIDHVTSEHPFLNHLR